MKTITEEKVFDVKNATIKALEFVRTTYSAIGEEVTNLGLEEINLEEGLWQITVGFSRPWSQSIEEEQSQDPVASMFGNRKQVISRLERDYKRVNINAETGEILGMEIVDS